VYFGIKAGSNVPPAMAAKSGEVLNRHAINTPAPAIALALRNCLLLTNAPVFISLLLSCFLSAFPQGSCHRASFGFS
jgi:hypothetical protein